MTIHIPAWVLWTLAGLAGTVVIGFAVIGFLLLKALGDMFKSGPSFFGW
jgi:hypothetical protein